MYEYVSSKTSKAMVGTNTTKFNNYLLNFKQKKRKVTQKTTIFNWKKIKLP